ncbi:MAG TPA: helix-turn-helix transcriptional regulator [Fibrobacteria bacterium]|nr:helix-turn-helix transcriptional regulator [Fibrobacteria bacterium]
MPKIKSIKSSGNIFADLGLDDAKEHRLRVKLAVRLLRQVESRRLTQTKAAGILGITQPELSRIKHAKLEHFSSDRLIRLLGKIGLDVAFTISDRVTKESETILV